MDSYKQYSEASMAGALFSGIWGRRRRRGI